MLLVSHRAGWPWECDDIEEGIDERVCAPRALDPLCDEMPLQDLRILTIGLHEPATIVDHPLFEAIRCDLRMELHRKIPAQHEGL